MGNALYKFAVTTMAPLDTSSIPEYKAPPAPKVLKADPAKHLDTPDLQSQETQISNNMGAIPNGVNTDYNGTQKTGNTQGYTSNWQQMSKVNGWAQAALPTAGALLTGGSLLYAGNEIDKYIDSATVKAKRKATSRIPRAILAAVASSLAGYKTNDYLRGYGEEADNAQKQLGVAQANARRTIRPFPMGKRSGLGGTLATLGIGTALLTPLALAQAKKRIDAEANERVDERTKYWTPGAAALGFGAGYLGNDLHEAYKDRQIISARDSYAQNVRALRGD